MLGRISCALGGLIDQCKLLEYLSWGSRSFNSELQVEGEELLMPVVSSDSANPTGTSDTRLKGMATLKAGSEMELSIPCNLSDVASSEYQCKEEDQIWRSVDLILAIVKDIWLLVQYRSYNEALLTLRACKEDLALVAQASPKLAGTLAFTQRYLHVIKLLAKALGCILEKGDCYGFGELENLLDKLDRRLKELRCRFVGYSAMEELHLLELMIMTLMLRLSKVDICCFQATLEKLSATISHVELLQRETSAEPSGFVNEVKKKLVDVGPNSNSANPYLVRKLIDLFSPRQLTVCRSLRQISVEFEISDNKTENPLPFVPGLPVAVPLKITLQNVQSESRLWARIRMHGEASQFVYLELDAQGDADGFKKFTCNLPFYSPRSGSLTLWIGLGMEYLFEGVHSVEGFGGPKHEFVHLCKEKEVYLQMVFR